MRPLSGFPHSHLEDHKPVEGRGLCDRGKAE